MWVPDALWWAYGDAAALATAYPAMAAHVRRVEGLLSPAGLWTAASSSATGSTPTPRRRQWRMMRER